MPIYGSCRCGPSHGGANGGAPVHGAAPLPWRQAWDAVPDGCLRRAPPQALRLCLGGPPQPNLRRRNGGQQLGGTAPAPTHDENRGRSGAIDTSWTKTYRRAVWLPAGGVGGDRPRRPARAGPKSRLQPTASRAQTPHKSAPRPGASTTRPPWPVDPEPAPPAGSHTARRSVQREPSRSALSRRASFCARRARFHRSAWESDRP